MTVNKTVLLMSVALVFGATSGGASATEQAVAPQAPVVVPPPTTAPSTRVQELVVTAPQQEGRTSIERHSYSLKNDIQSSVGSIADALRNIPSVNVDMQGVISLRGSTSVTILVDGKPSTAFSGPDGAAALQQLPSNQFERVEVITTPSAAFRPDGSAGIINLISKSGRAPGRTGSGTLSHGSAGRVNASATTNLNGKSGGLTVGLSGSRQDQKLTAVDERSRTDGTPTSEHRTISSGSSDLFNVRLGGNYDVDDRRRLSGDIRIRELDFRSKESAEFDSTGPGSELRRGRSRFESPNRAASLTYRQKFSGDGHQLTGTLSHDYTRSDASRDLVSSDPMTGAEIREGDASRDRREITNLRLAYTRGTELFGDLEAGAEVYADRFSSRSSSLLRQGSTGADALVQDADRFKYRRTSEAIYGVVERRFGDLTARAGLRVEYTHTVGLQAVGLRRSEQTYTYTYPSLHLRYSLDDKSNLFSSYSRRVDRPSPDDLNPFRVYQDPFTAREGNADLEPAKTNSFEGGYEFRRDQTNFTATLYYRETYDVIFNYVRDLGDDVILASRANQGQGSSLGVELIYKRKLGRDVTLDTSGGLARNEISAPALGFDERSRTTVSGRANLTWQARPRDVLQASVTGVSRRLTVQGYREPSGALNFGYRHTFNPRLSGVITIQDALDTLRDRQVVVQPDFKDRVQRKYDGRAVFVGLSYSFGGPARASSGFDYDGADAVPK
jgi:outer membrane receptor protein involved in Fe transport